MQTVYEDEAIAIAPQQDGCLLSDFQNTLRDLLDGLWFERCAALYARRCSRSQIFLASSWSVSESAPTRNPVTSDIAVKGLLILIKGNAILNPNSWRFGE
jgi:hypothetical protein